MRSVHGDQATVAARSFHPGAPRNAHGAHLDLAVGVCPAACRAQADRNETGSSTTISHKMA
jgi:hypothetical protein